MISQLDFELPYTLSDLTGTNRGPFATEFTCEEVTDVEVYYWPPGGQPELLTRDTQYTLAGANPQLNGYDITLTSVIGGASWPAGAQLLRVRATEERQDAEFADNLGSRPSVVGRLLNRLTRIAQEQKMIADRAPKVPFGELGPRFLSESERAGAMIGYDEDGVTPIARNLSEFDANVAQVADDRVATEAANAGAAAAQQAAEQARDASQNLFDSIEPATIEAVSQILSNYEAAAQNLDNVINVGLEGLDLQKEAGLEALQTQTSLSQDTIAADLSDAQAAIAGDKQAAADSAAAAATTAEEVQTFYDTAIQPLPDRVAALENAALTVSLSASTTQAENGSSVAVTLSRTLSQAVTTATIDQGVGAVATTAGTVAGIATGANVTANRTWTLTVTTPGGTRTATASIAFLNRMFWGAYATNDLHTKTAAEIRAALVATSALATNANRSMTITPAGTQFIYVAIPTGFSLSRLTAYGFDELENCVSDAVTVNDAGGTARNYTLYRLPFALTGAVEVQTYA